MGWSFGRGPMVGLVCCGAFAAAPPVVAKTLTEALTEAYRSNPTLAAARAGQRATDEQVNIQRANGRPNAGVTATYTENLDALVRVTTPFRSFGAQGQVQVPLYNGGAVRNAISAAKLRVESGQIGLRANEASLFASVVAAYMDVIRDTAVLGLNQRNVNALGVNLRASRDRFEVGDVTRTDVAQSESRLALARANLETAQAQLTASRENFIALVGSPPEDLQSPPPLPGLPDSPDTAVTIALADNPDIKAAQKASAAARYDVKSAKGRVMPSISAFANGSYSNALNSLAGDLSFFPGVNRSVAAGASLTVPLYQGGRPGAQQRAAIAQEEAAIEQAIQAERSIISQVRASFASWRAATQAIESTRTAVSAANLSLEGVKAENSVGSRTILDILNAEQEALNAEVQYVTAQRNAYVAAFSLLAAMGHARASDIGLDPAILYNPQANYDRVRGKLVDFDFDPTPPGASDGEPTTTR